MADLASRTVVVTAPTRQVLPDGTTVDLRAGASIRVAFDASTRRVILERGAAHFEVTKDAQRPFIVGAGAVVTTDVPPMAIVAGVPAKLVRYRDGRQPVEGAE